MRFASNNLICRGFATVLVVAVAGLQGCCTTAPAIVRTVNQNQAWQERFTRDHLIVFEKQLDAVRFKSDRFLIGDGRSASAEGVLRVGDTFILQDDHGRTTYTLKQLTADSATIDYKSSFDQSFGKNQIDIDTGTIAVPYTTR